MVISQKWHFGLLLPILHSLSVKELFMHTLCHATLQFYKCFIRKVQVCFPCAIDSGFLHAACFVWPMDYSVGVMGIEALLCVHALACPLTLLPPAMRRRCLKQLWAKEYEKTYGEAWTQAIAGSQDQNSSLGFSWSKGYIWCFKWEISAYYFKPLEFRLFGVVKQQNCSKTLSDVFCIFPFLSYNSYSLREFVL